MVERYTEATRRVIVLAQEEARVFKHNYIGTEHILLGLVRVEEDGIATPTLTSFNITAGQVRAQVVRIVGKGDEAPAGQIPYTPRAKKVLELAFREMLSLGHDEIEPGHVLLGVIREGEGTADRILRDLKAEPQEVHNRVRLAFQEQQASAKPAGPACSQCGEFMTPAHGIYICLACGNNTAPSEVQAFLAEWHQAAEEADEKRFFSMMAEDATFVGTDDEQIFTKKVFREASADKFARAPAWSLRQTKFQVISGEGTTVSFVELLENDECGIYRGSGVVRWEDSGWKIVLYVLSVSVPNQAFEAVQAAIKAS